MKPEEKVAGEGKLFGHPGGAGRDRPPLLIGAETPHRRAQADLHPFGGLGNDVDHAAGRVGAIECGAGAAHDFHAGYSIERDGDVHVVMPGLDIVEALAVEQHEGLSEIRAADGEIGLHSVGGALLEIERRVEPEQVEERIEHQGVAAGGEHANGAIDLFERHGLEGAGHDDGFMRRRLLGRCG